MQKHRLTNEQFYDEYKYFDIRLCEHLGVEENGIAEYIRRMWHGYYEVKDILPEWEPTMERLIKIKERYDALKAAKLSFDDFQGGGEDVVYIRIFLEKIDSKADPLTKYKSIDFNFKKKKKSLLKRFLDLFG